MSEIYCNNCFKQSVSSDGVSCYYCESYDTRQIFRSNHHPAVPKPDNAGIRYWIPDGCSLLMNTNTEAVTEVPILLGRASIPTKVMDFNNYNQNDHRHVDEKSITNECLPVFETCNTFDQDSTTNWKSSPVNHIVNEYQPATIMPLNEYEPATMHLKEYEPATIMPLNEYEPATMHLNEYEPATIMPSNEIVHKTNCNQPSLYPDTETSRIQGVSPVDDFLAVAGPSGLQNKMKMSKLCEEHLQLGNFSQKHSISPRSKNFYICRFCNKDISKHKHDGENYKCCHCPYQSSERANLQRHSYYHKPAKFCRTCLNEYVCDSHNDFHTCEVCRKTFLCRNQLREHYFDKSHGCWYCCNDIENDCTDRNKNNMLQCCVCGFETTVKVALIKHKTTHMPKTFCKICKEEFAAAEEQFHGKILSCILCGKTFKCQTQLEDHLMDDEKYLSTHCPICKKELKDHRFKRNEKLVFKCCKCLIIIRYRCFKDLTAHLLKHLNLRFLKCDLCGKRYFKYKHLYRHSKICKTIPFKCEICGLGFEDKDFLDIHRSEIHN